MIKRKVVYLRSISPNAFRELAVIDHIVDFCIAFMIYGAIITTAFVGIAITTSNHTLASSLYVCCALMIIPILASLGGYTKRLFKYRVQIRNENDVKAAMHFLDASSLEVKKDYRVFVTRNGIDRTVFCFRKSGAATLFMLGWG